MNCGAFWFNKIKLLSPENFSPVFYGKIYSIIADATHKDISGVYELDSGKKGPTVGILMMTHGNEPCGLSIPQLFLKNKNALTRGKLLFILQNEKASKDGMRFKDCNMNRIKGLPNKKSPLYEVRPVAELRKIYNECEYLLDFHSTSQKSLAMIVTFGVASTKAVHRITGVPVIQDIHKVQIGKPVVSFGKTSSKKIGFECGYHNGKEAQENTLAFCLSMLQKLKMTDLISKKTFSKGIERYKAVKGVVLPEGYQLTRRFKNFEFLPKGTILATSLTKEMVTDKNYYSVFCAKDYKNTPKNEEAVFLLEKTK